MVWLAPAIAATAGLVSSIAARRSAKKDYERMNRYNAPKEQMRRFQDAGLSPSLMYGQGNAGNQSSTPPPIDFSRVTPEAIQAMNTTRMTQAQVEAVNANTRRVGVLTQVNELQRDVLKKNPYLNESAYNAIISSLKASAESKAARAGLDRSIGEFYGRRAYVEGIGETDVMGIKLDREMMLLNDRFNLNQYDQKIKAQVIESKEFQNALSEIQMKWMRDAEITPQHIYQFIIMLLQKIASK